MLPDVALHRPVSLDEAVGMLDWDNVGYAGGTELVPAMRLGVRRPDALVDLKRIPELRGIHVVGGGGGETLAIGALTTHRELAANAHTLRLVPMLAEVVAHVGNVRVRSTGTIGGNLAFAEPRSDLATACVALDASVEVAGPHGVRRTITVEELVVGPYETTLEPNELLVRLLVPARQRPGARYWKLQPMERPTLGVAIVPDRDQAIVVVGAATERPARTMLPSGTDRTATEVRQFCAGLELITDVTGSAEYKRAVLLHHLLGELGKEGAA